MSNDTTKGENVEIWGTFEPNKSIFLFRVPPAPQ